MTYTIRQFDTLAQYVTYLENDMPINDDNLPINDVGEINPQPDTIAQKFESLDQAKAQAVDVEKAMEEKAKAGDILGALKIGASFVKGFLLVLAIAILSGCGGSYQSYEMDSGGAAQPKAQTVPTCTRCRAN